MKKTNHKTAESAGAELFDNYVAAKKALTEKIKSVLEIMAQCKVIDVVPPDARPYVMQKLKDVAIHQWQYNAGHETIYCQHAYSFRHGIEKCTVKIPVKFLGMTTEELMAVNYDEAIKALEEKKKALKHQRDMVCSPIDKKMAAIDEQIGRLSRGELRTA